MRPTGTQHPANDSPPFQKLAQQPVVLQRPGTRRERTLETARGTRRVRPGPSLAGGRGAGAVTRAEAWPRALRSWADVGCKGAGRLRGVAGQQAPRLHLGTARLSLSYDKGTTGWGSGCAPLTYTADGAWIHSRTWTCCSSESEETGAAPPHASRGSQCVCGGPGACSPGGAEAPGAQTFWAGP